MLINMRLQHPLYAGAATLAKHSAGSGEGAAMMRTKGEAGTGDIVEGSSTHASCE